MFQYPEFKSTARFQSTTTIPHPLILINAPVLAQMPSPKSCRSEPYNHNRPVSELERKMSATDEAWKDLYCSATGERVRRKLIFPRDNGNDATQGRNLPITTNFKIINYGPIEMNCLNPSVKKHSPNCQPKKYHNSNQYNSPKLTVAQQSGHNRYCNID